MELGTIFARPSLVEAEAAEKLLSVLPRADMVKFAKNGSDATTGAVRLARAITGRDHVAICRDHPFFSVDDWFIGVSAMTRRHPEGHPLLQTLTFAYGDLDLPHPEPAPRATPTRSPASSSRGRQTTRAARP